MLSPPPCLPPPSLLTPLSPGVFTTTQVTGHSSRTQTNHDTSHGTQLAHPNHNTSHGTQLVHLLGLLLLLLLLLGLFLLLLLGPRLLLLGRLLCLLLRSRTQHNNTTQVTEHSSRTQPTTKHKSRDTARAPSWPPRAPNTTTQHKSRDTARAPNPQHKSRAVVHLSLSRCLAVRTDVGSCSLLLPTSVPCKPFSWFFLRI